MVADVAREDARDGARGARAVRVVLACTVDTLVSHNSPHARDRARGLKKRKEALT